MRGKGEMGDDVGRTGREPGNGRTRARTCARGSGRPKSASAATGGDNRREWREGEGGLASGGEFWFELAFETTAASGHYRYLFGHCLVVRGCWAGFVLVRCGTQHARFIHGSSASRRGKMPTPHRSLHCATTQERYLSRVLEPVLGFGLIGCSVEMGAKVPPRTSQTAPRVAVKARWRGERGAAVRVSQGDKAAMATSLGLFLFLLPPHCFLGADDPC